ncbi:MAG: tryptophan--tRNA ligase [Candidatus Omnitrophica bacterium]|nr:tryptophan--tRNA ligase [Candidatus Omnitrophota bacterium]
MKKKERILTGDRPTGKLHLGHYVGSIANRVELQETYEEYILIADVQALTTNFDHPERLAQDIREVTMDNIACGVDPEISTIFLQSMIPEITELTIYFSMFTSIASLQRNPTIKQEIKALGLSDNVMYGFLGYPVSQAADITIFKANLVPVGEDQLPIIEQTREIVRKFNRMYQEVLIEPKAQVGVVGRLVGTDGLNKMSKSLGNVIYLSDGPDEISCRVSGMFTDPTKIRLNDKGHPDKCPVYIYHRGFNKNEAEVPQIKKDCLAGRLGCVECKKRLSGGLNEFLGPIREKRKKLEAHPKKIDDILIEGTKKARGIAVDTIKSVRAAMKINYFSG